MTTRMAVAVALCAATAASAAPRPLELLAGRGAMGREAAQGPAHELRLDRPGAFALSPRGELIFVESAADRVRRLDLELGYVTTLAGRGDPGDEGDGGPARLARLSWPTSVAVADDGSIYVSDSGNHRVRRIDARTGRIASVAGTGAAGHDGDEGPALSLRLDSPEGLAFDAEGRLLICDRGNHRLRRVELRSGRMETLAGTGDTAFESAEVLARFGALSAPRAVVVAADGRIFVADSGHRCVRVISPDGLMRLAAGCGASGTSGDGGPATEARFIEPAALAFDGWGNLLIADAGAGAIRKLELASGRISTLREDLERPLGIGLDPQGALLISGGARLERLPQSFAPALSLVGWGLDPRATRALTAAGGLVTKLAPQARFTTREPAPGSAIEVTLRGAEVRPGDALAVCAVGGVELRGAELSVDGLPVAEVRPSGGRATASIAGGAALLRVRFAGTARRGDVERCLRALAVQPRAESSPRDLALEVELTLSGGGLERCAARVEVRAAQGVELAAASELDSFSPSGLAVALGGRLFVADRGAHKVLALDGTSPALRGFAGSGAEGDEGDWGAAGQARLDSPAGLAFDPRGAVFIADAENHRVRRVDLRTETVTTIAGCGEPGHVGDGGDARLARLNRPLAVALDGAGHILIADTDNHAIRRVDARTGHIETLAGTGVGGFNGDGPAAQAQLLSPCSIAVDGEGRVIIADRMNHRVRRLDLRARRLETLAGTGTPGSTGDDGPAHLAQLCRPQAVAVDGAGNIYIADSGNLQLRKLEAGTGLIRALPVGASTPPGGPSGPIDSPTALAIDAAGGLVIADAERRLIRRYGS